MNTATVTITADFDAHANCGRGQAGFTATTANGIARFAPTAAAAEAKALAQEAAYREAGMLDEVVARLAA